MNNIKFSVRINEQDLYRFNLFHTYTSTQGILSVVLFVLLIAVWIMRFSMLSPIYRLFYPLVAIIFLVYIPGSLKLRVKNQMTQEVFKHPLTYELTESGIMVSSPASEDPLSKRKASSWCTTGTAFLKTVFFPNPAFFKFREMEPPRMKGDIAQLARAPALQAGGQGFKPPYLQ